MICVISCAPAFQIANGDFGPNQMLGDRTEVVSCVII